VAGTDGHGCLPARFLNLAGKAQIGSTSGVSTREIGRRFGITQVYIKYISGITQVYVSYNSDVPRIGKEANSASEYRKYTPD